MLKKIVFTRFPDFPINFDQIKYDNIPTNEEKGTYLISLLKSFFASYHDEIPISMNTQGNIKLNDFLNILSNSFQYVNIKLNYDIMATFLVAFEPFYTELPKIESYIQISDCLIDALFESPNNLYIHTLSIFFRNPQFCNLFLNSRKMIEIFERCKSNNSKLKQFLEVFDSPILFDTIKQMPNYKECLIGLFQCVFSNIETMDIQNTIDLLRFLLNICMKLFHYFQSKLNNPHQQIFKDVLFQTGFFDSINTFLLQIPKIDIAWTFYHSLLGCSPDPKEIPYDLSVFLQLNKLYINEHFPISCKLFILKEILNDKVIFESPFAINQSQFPIHLFLCPEVVKSENLFFVYVGILSKCIDQDQSFADLSIHRLIDLLSPPLNKDEILYENVFQWLAAIVDPQSKDPISTDIFNDAYFFQKLLIDPPLEVAQQYFDFQHYNELFGFLFDSRRNKFKKKIIISRIFDIINLDKQKYIQQLQLNKMLLANFDVAILNFYIDNLANGDVLKDFGSIRSSILVHIPRLFRVGNTFKIVEKHLVSFPEQNQTYLLELLMFIHSIVINSKDRFFDEWVMTLPKDSPLFQLSSDVLSSFVYNTTIIFIPSLVPLVIKDLNIESYSPYNLYLIGRYSVPIALKLGIALPQMQLIVSNYISHDTYEYFLETGHIVNLLKKSAQKEAIPCYEFFLGSLPGYITLPEDDFALIMFWINFTDVTNKQFPFLRFSKCFLAIDSESISLFDNKQNLALKTIRANQWYLIRIQRTKLMNWTDVYIDNVKVTTVKENFQFNMIGDSEHQVPASYFVAQNIFGSSFIPDSKFISNFNYYSPSKLNPILKGSVVAAPIFSISHLLSHNFCFLHNFDKFDEIIESQQKLGLHEKAQNNTEHSNKFESIKEIEQYFVFLIQTADYLNDNHLFLFYNRLLQSLMKMSDFCSQFYIIALIQSIMMLKNIRVRTEIFGLVLFHIDVWSTLKIERLVEAVEYFNENIRDNETLEWNLIFTKPHFLISASLIAFSNSDDLFNQFFIFWERAIVKTCNFELLRELSVIRMPGSLNASSSIDCLEISEIIGPNKYSNINERIVIQLNLLLLKYQKNLMTYPQLLYLSFVYRNDDVKQFFFEVLTSDIDFLIHKKEIIQLIAQRYCDDSTCWSCFLSIVLDRKDVQFDLTNEHFSFDSFEKPLKVPNPEFLSFLIEMFIALLSKKDGDEVQLSQKIGHAIKLLSSLITVIDPLNLIDDSNISSFIHLIDTNQYKKKPILDLNQILWPSSTKNSEIEAFKSKIINNQEKIIERIGEYKMDLKVDLSDEFTQFLFSVIVRIFFGFTEKKSLQIDKILLTKFLSIVATLCNDSTLSQFLDQIFVLIQLSSFSIDVSSSLIDFISYLLLTRGSTVFRLETFTSIIRFASKLSLSNDSVVNHEFSRRDSGSRRNSASSPRRNSNGSGSRRSSCISEPEYFQFFIPFFIFSFENVLQLALNSDKKVSIVYLKKIHEHSMYIAFQYPQFALYFIYTCLKYHVVDTDGEISDFFNIVKNQPNIENFQFSHVLMNSESYESLFDVDLSEYSQIMNDIKQNVWPEMFTDLQFVPTAETSLYDRYTTQIVASNITNYYYESREYFQYINRQMRLCEYNTSFFLFQTTINKSQSGRLPVRSYRVNPFVYPSVCPVVCMPSIFSIKSPKPISLTAKGTSPIFTTTEKDNKINKSKSLNSLTKTETIRKDLILFYTKFKPLNIQVSKEIPCDLFKRSILLNLDETYLKTQFECIYGAIQQIHNCTLVRQNLRVPSICFKMVPIPNRCTRYFILTDSSFSKCSTIELSEPTPLLAESILSNDFGPFSMFCGHFLICIEEDCILRSTNFGSKSSTNLIFSVSNGFFILEFSFFSIISWNKYEGCIDIALNKWVNNAMSNKEYLDAVNFFGMRSFADFSVYPIYPRLLNELNRFLTGGLPEFNVLINKINENKKHQINTQRSMNELTLNPEIIMNEENNQQIASNQNSIDDNAIIQNETQSNQIQSNETQSNQIQNENQSNENQSKHIQNENQSKHIQNETQSNQIQSNETQSNQIQNENQSNETLSNQIQNENQSNENQSKHIQNENQSKHIQNETQSNQIQSNETQSNQIQSNEISSNDGQLITNDSTSNENEIITSKLTSNQIMGDENSPDDQNTKQVHFNEIDTTANDNPIDHKIHQMSDNSPNESKVQLDNEESFLSNFRDLSKPIQVLNNDNKQIYINRYKTNNFHYSENLSNPLIVSSLNLRLAPFCFTQWDLNDGWDKGERNFTSIEQHLSIGKKTIFELPPEFYCFPELLMNKNNFRLNNNEVLNVKFPVWCKCNHCENCRNNQPCPKSPFYFIEYMKYILELDIVRKNLNQWIDINFGFKQNSVDDINVYSPLSYFYLNNDSQEEERRAWVLQCGQVPKQIFDKPHPPYKTKCKDFSTKSTIFQQMNPLNFVFVPHELDYRSFLNFKQFENTEKTSSIFLKYPSNVYIARITENCLIKIENNIQLYINDFSLSINIHPPLFFKQDVCVNNKFIGITYSMSLVVVLEIIRTDKSYTLRTVGQLRCTYVKSSNKNSELNRNLDNAFIDDNNIINTNNDKEYHDSTALFSVLHSKQFLCATVCRNEIIIWCFTSSLIVARIPFRDNLSNNNEIGVVETYQPNENQDDYLSYDNLIDDDNVQVTTAIFDEELNTLFIGTSNGELHQYSLNGFLIRKIKLHAGISAIQIMPSGYSIFDRYIITGHIDGSIKIIKIDIISKEFQLVRHKKLCRLAIEKIETEMNSQNIDVYVSPSTIL